MTVNTAFICKKCGGNIEAKNELAYQMLLKGQITLCDECRRGKHVQHWTKETYQEYLKTEHWQTRRERALRFAGHRCQICNCNGRLQVHHNTYERLGRELDRDLLVVCEAHHEMIHGIN